MATLLLHTPNISSRLIFFGYETYTRRGSCGFLEILEKLDCLHLRINSWKYFSVFRNVLFGNTINKPLVNGDRGGVSQKFWEKKNNLIMQIYHGDFSQGLHKIFVGKKDTIAKILKLLEAFLILLPFIRGKLEIWSKKGSLPNFRDFRSCLR